MAIEFKIGAETYLNKIEEMIQKSRDESANHELKHLFSAMSNLEIAKSNVYTRQAKTQTILDKTVINNEELEDYQFVKDVENMFSCIKEYQIYSEREIDLFLDLIEKLILRLNSTISDTESARLDLIKDKINREPQEPVVEEPQEVKRDISDGAITKLKKLRQEMEKEINLEEETEEEEISIPIHKYSYKCVDCKNIYSKVNQVLICCRGIYEVNYL